MKAWVSPLPPEDFEFQEGSPALDETENMFWVYKPVSKETSDDILDLSPTSLSQKYP